jgi:RNA polymerase sigma-70 factor, ECF subfamily
MGEREERFTRLFAAAYQPLEAYARRRVGPDEASDLVAEVLTVAWRKIDEIPDDNALPWLYAVAYRTAGNVHRARRRRLRLLGRLTARTPTFTAPYDPAAIDADILSALERLRPEDQEVLQLAAWEDLGPTEIAVVLRCSSNAAAIRLSRARQRLREALKGLHAGRTHDPRRQMDA